MKKYVTIPGGDKTLKKKTQDGNYIKIPYYSKKDKDEKTISFRKRYGFIRIPTFFCTFCFNLKIQNICCGASSMWCNTITEP